MKSDGRPQINRLSLTQLNRIDSVCTKYEVEVVRSLEDLSGDSTNQTGSRATLEHCLIGFDGDERAQLLRELLEIDVELREGRGEKPQDSDYAHLSAAGDQTVVRSVFDTKHITQTHSGVRTDSNARAVRQHGKTASEKPLEIGTCIGPYELKRCLGEGGMGVVYLAEQSEPIARQVALKVVRSDLGSARIIERFQQEQQALAAMDHPNVARVLDAGTSENHVPYFVMELVDGLPITDYCWKNELGLAERLRLLVQVCQAVQHAHQKGIIHRDLKPSNVLVTSYDGEPVPKVIDFGLATAVREGVIHDESKTEAGTVLGTFQYMSPEQADTGNADVDTRSDVYSLGVLLYELLTGRTPISREDLRSASYFEILQRIREAEPTAPSRSPIDCGDASDPRGRERWASDLQGDLDWITLRSLARNRDHRYETALALGADLQHFLNDEPVEAGPPSARYRMSKFVRRNRVPVAAAALASISLVAGLVLATVGFVRAKDAKDELASVNKSLLVANVSLDQRLKETQAAREAEESANDRARTDAATTEAVNRFLSRILQAASPRVLGKDATVLAALDYTSDNIGKEFPDLPRVRMAVLASLASTYSSLGEYAKAETHGREAVSLYAETLGEEDLSTLRAQDQLAAILFNSDKREEAVELMQSVCEAMKRQLGMEHRDTLVTHNNLATFLARRNQLPAAIEILEEVLDAKRRKLGDTDDSTLTTWGNLSALRAQAGEKKTAIVSMRKIFAITKEKHGPRHHQTIGALDQLAITQSFVDVREAIPLYEELVQLRFDFLGADHPQTIRTKLLLATSLLGVGRAAAAEPLLRNCVAWNEANSESRGTRVNADLHLVVALAVQSSEMFEKAEEAEQIARSFTKLVESKAPPGTPPVFMAKVHVGVSVLAQERYEEAEAILRECYDGLRKYRGVPDDLMGFVQSQLGITLLKLERPDEARPFVKAGHAQLKNMKGDDHVLTRAAATAAKELGIEIPQEL